MHRRVSFAFILAGAAIAATAASARFAGPPQYDLSWNTVDGGGGTSLGAGFELSGTIGQPDAGPALTGGQFGGQFELAGGFWVAPGIVETCPADIAPQPGGNDVVNVDDLLAIINGWGACPPPPTACPSDIAPPPGGNDLVNVDDLLAVINAWGACP